MRRFPVSEPILVDQLLAGNGQAIFLLVLVAVGVLISYMFSVSRNFEGTKPAIRSLAPTISDKMLNRLDLIAVITFGPVIAAILLNPSSYVEALTAGVGWVGALNTITGSGK